MSVPKQILAPVRHHSCDHHLWGTKLVVPDRLRGTGDSITEHFMGTSGGLPEMQKNNGSAVSPDMAADVAVWKRNFGFRYRAAVAAIAGAPLHGGQPATRLPAGRPAHPKPSHAICEGYPDHAAG